MERRYSFFLLTLFTVVILGWMQQTSAQHTMIVPWDDGSGNVKVNALYNAVMGDTNANGSRADLDRVYQLKKGGVYWNTEHFVNQQNGNTFALRFVGETPDPTDVYGNPPTLQMVARQDASVDGKILNSNGDVYMKNLYIIGSDNTGVQTYYQPMEFNGNGYHATFDNVIFERSNFAMTAWNGKNNVISFTNCKWYNLVERPITQQWTGRGFTCWSDQDSVIVENCTFDNVGFSVVQIEGGAAKYFRFVHNTCINVGRSLHSTSGNWWREAYFADNLLINPYFDAEGWVDYSPQAAPTRTTFYTGLMAISHLPDSYGPDLGRRIVFANNTACLAQTFRKEWDSIRVQPFINAVTDSFFTTYSPANGGQMVIKDTVWLSKMPSFTKFDTTNYPKMIQFIKNIRAGVTPIPSWMQDLQLGSTDTLWTAPQWPLVQNFAYTDNLKGTDGLPLGDLNWFPTQLATWEANKVKFIGDIQAIAGAPIIITPVATIEAEEGTVGGTAAKTQVQGLTYYDYSGSGSITWTFTAPSAGVYDTKWYVNETGRGQSGPNLAINGNALHDKAHGWGQFIFDPLLGPSWGMPNNEWIWVPITADTVLASESAAFTLAAGTNTIGVTGGGWGEVKFAEVDVWKHGTTDVIALKAPAAVPSLVKAGAEGVKWVASGFNYVTMGNAGTVTFSVNAPQAGTYRVSCSYQNPGSSQSGSITVDANQLAATFAGNPDSSVSMAFVSASFPLTAGTHSITVAAGKINLDYVVLNLQTVDVASDRHQQMSYALEQNYPNPFNPTTKINFSLAKSTKVELNVYNILGQKMMTLVNGVMSSGAHTVQFNAINLPSGVYFYGIKTQEFESYKKMMLIK